MCGESLATWPLVQGPAMLLIEHRWAVGLRDAISDAEGSVVLQGFLTLEGLALIGADLAAAEAIAAIELAEEVNAAVVARTVLGLVEAGFIEGADALNAAAVLVDDAILESATPSEGNS